MTEQRRPIIACHIYPTESHHAVSTAKALDWLEATFAAAGFTVTRDPDTVTAFDRHGGPSWSATFRTSTEVLP